MTEGTVRRWLPTFVVAGLMAGACIGCRPRGEQRAYPVSGSVRIDGRSAERALVVFHPLGNQNSNAVRPHGEAAADGSFTIDAPAGDYIVTVELWLASEKRFDDSPPTNRLPAKYASAKSSGLTAHVGEGPTVLQPFELTR